jgi:hypothetical protein
VYAVLISVTVEDEERAREQLAERVVPAVSAIPGAVHGYWLAPVGGEGYSTVIYESEEAATDAAAQVHDRAPQGVTVNDVSVREVVAHF